MATGTSPPTFFTCRGIGRKGQAHVYDSLTQSFRLKDRPKTELTPRQRIERTLEKWEKQVEPSKERELERLWTERLTQGVGVCLPCRLWFPSPEACKQHEKQIHRL